jgi:hypothetical protein
MDILLGILLVVFGLAITFFGLQVFFATLPILGFIFGFFVGAGIIHQFWSDSFLSTATGWIVGIIVGLVFALISWFWWYAGALLAAGAWGAVLGTAILSLFSSSPSDFSLFLFAAVGFAAILVLALVLNLPIYVVIVSTAWAGASILIAGVLLVFNRIDYQELGNGTAATIINDSWWWSLVAIVAAVLGMFFQLMMKAAITLPEERWTPATSAA